MGEDYPDRDLVGDYPDPNLGGDYPDLDPFSQKKAGYPERQEKSEPTCDIIRILS